MTIRVLLGFVFAWAASFAAFAQAPNPGTVFRDCPDCPEMVVIPPDSFTMGSPESETGRYKNEGPQRNVTIAYGLAVGRHEVTRGQYAQFLRESGHTLVAGNCWYWDGDEGRAKNDDASKVWHSPGFAQGDDHPVVCVSWVDAKAYAAWLARKTGMTYRLLTEAEWEYAARSRSSTARPWGDDPNQACAHSNVGDLARNRIVSPGKGKRWAQFHDCEDGYGYTSPVGRFAPNRFGLYDMIGNVWEWTEDCWNNSYVGAPTDGSAWLAGNCARRVFRGTSWDFIPRLARTATREGGTTGDRGSDVGFRLARTF